MEPETGTPILSVDSHTHYISSLRKPSWPLKLLVMHKKKEYHVSTKASLVAMVNALDETNHDILRKLGGEQFPREIRFEKVHPFGIEDKSFWRYLSYFHGKRPNSLVFLRFESGDESNSKRVFFSGRNDHFCLFENKVLNFCLIEYFEILFFVPPKIVSAYSNVICCTQF